MKGKRKSLKSEMNMESMKKSKGSDMCVNPQLWNAVAGSVVQMPEVNSKIFYFPQGHAEHACEPVNFSGFSKISCYTQCRVVAIKYMADHETDEVYAKLSLVPIHSNEISFEEDGVGHSGESETNKDKSQSYAKILTQSDANNGGGFSCPRYCAETLFPPLDYSANPPFQDLYPKDIHGKTWFLRHVFRGTPKRHLLTTGWSDFVTDKKLVAGDSMVFLRAENGDIHVGIRRGKSLDEAISDPPSGFQPDGGIVPVSSGGIIPVPYGGFASFSGGEDDKIVRNGRRNGLRISDGMMGRGKVRAQEVIEAVTLAANLQPFEVTYYPRSSTPEFFVKTSVLRNSLQIRWCLGMRFKMAIETEDSSKISWYMGTVASVQAADPAWPDSHWRLLQVTWDEPELLKNVKRLNPWSVEIVSNIPSINLPSCNSPRRRLRLPQHPNLPLDGLFPMPNFSNNFLTPNVPFLTLPEINPAGMQGARHPHFGFPLSDFHLNQPQFGYFQPSFQPFNHTATMPMTVPNNPEVQKPNTSDNDSCLLLLSGSSQSPKEPVRAKQPIKFVLFGETILIDSETSPSTTAETRNKNDENQGLPDRSSCERFPSNHKNQCEETPASLDTVTSSKKQED